MTPNPATFEVAFRERTGRPWVVLATEPTRDAATARMFELMRTRTGGGWHVRPTTQTGGAVAAGCSS